MPARPPSPALTEATPVHHAGRRRAGRTGPRYGVGTGVHCRDGVTPGSGLPITASGM